MARGNSLSKKTPFSGKKKSNNPSPNWAKIAAHTFQAGMPGNIVKVGTLCQSLYCVFTMDGGRRTPFSQEAARTGDKMASDRESLSRTPRQPNQEPLASDAKAFLIESLLRSDATMEHRYADLGEIFSKVEVTDVANG
jgi:hypothetical protein